MAQPVGVTPVEGHGEEMMESNEQVSAKRALQAEEAASLRRRIGAITPFGQDDPDGDRGVDLQLVIASLDQVASLYIDGAQRQELREEEIVKLKEMSSFTAMKQKGVLAAAPRFRPKWVDTPDKQRV